jgi:hypothetical protein
VIDEASARQPRQDRGVHLKGAFGAHIELVQE